MEAIECSDEAIEILSEIYGERSKRLASKMYQRANSLLILNRKPEAIESIDKAIDLHDNPEADKYKPAGSEDAEKEGKGNTADQAMNFNRIQYQNFLASSLFMHGKDWARTIKEAEKGVELCKAFNFEPLKPEADRMLNEFNGIKNKARAKSQNTNALELLEKEENEIKTDDDDLKVVAQKSFSTSSALTAFAVTSGIVYLSILGFQKFKN